MFAGIMPGGIVAVLTIVGAFAVPIIGIVMFFTFMSKVVRAKHKEKIAMIEHGLTEPPRGKRGKGLLVTGLVFGAIGLAFVIGLPIGGATRQIGVGFVPLFIGLALIGGYYLTRKEEAKDESRSGA